MPQVVTAILGILLIFFAGGITTICIWRTTGRYYTVADPDGETSQITRRLDRQAIWSFFAPMANLMAVVGSVLLFVALLSPGAPLNRPIEIIPPSEPPPAPAPLPGPPSLPSVAPTPEALILPSRMFAGPSQYPPKTFKAYGIVAFPSRPTSDDFARYEMICDAYVAGLLHYTSVKVPVKEQMVTVWPIETAQLADEINRKRRDLVCIDAVPKYGLALAQDAIASARRQKAVLDGQGPFLLGWAPGAAKDQSDALVLVADMSDVVNLQQAKQIFAQWALDIQENPDLWNNGWKEEKLKLVIRLWVDKWGDKIIRAIGMKS